MRKRQAILLFAAAGAIPAITLMAAALLGGVWPVIALLSITALVLSMDRLGVTTTACDAFERTLPATLAAAHFAALAATLWAVGHTSHLDLGQKAALIVAMGLFAGQVSNAVAHELVHRTSKSAKRLGTAIYCSLLNGQHVSAHLLLHHPFAGTGKDPCSAPLGRSYYRFAWMASRAEFVEGWRAESQRRQSAQKTPHPYLFYLCGAGASALAAFAIGGGAALIALLLIALHAQSQLLLSDYVQHYGLRRRQLASGKLEPMGPEHSWNAPHSYSAAMMLNAPLHSAHHMQPGRRFSTLTLDAQTMPVLPYALPVMGTIALIPPLWRRIMDPEVRRWMSTQHCRDASYPPPKSNFISAT